MRMYQARTESEGIHAAEGVLVLRTLGTALVVAVWVVAIVFTVKNHTFWFILVPLVCSGALGPIWRKKHTPKHGANTQG